MYILGISCFYHDSAATLLKDGEIVAAAAEERFTRIKHDNNFPNKAIDFCLRYAGIAINQVDAVIFYEKPILKFERILNQHLQCSPKSYQSFIKTAGSWLNQKLNIRKILKEELHYYGKVYFIPHHLSHAASAYYLSPFQSASIITLDGVGEWATTTIGKGSDTKVEIVKEVNFPHSLGLLYSTLTTYLGFSANNSEYKVMGLAAYGDPQPFRKQFDELISTNKDGSYSLNLEYFDFEWSEKRMYSEKLIKLFKHPAREPESEAHSYHENIAAALQEKLEQVVFHILDKTFKDQQNTNLCLAGGVALNSVLNGKILKKTKFKQLFIPPDPSDAGGSMGAALYLWNQNQDKKNTVSFTPYLGPSFQYYEIRKKLKQRKIKYSLLSKRKLIKTVARYIKEQKVIGWFQGRMEWGPRALGARSIIAAANTEEMRDIINARIKHRELFRPFAPVILEEQVEKYFESDKNLPISAKWMLMVYPFKAIGKNKVPAVYHVDGTGRLQTIARKDNSWYYDVIDEYYRLTGIPIIINTSFNVRGEPIVCTPEDAINCFLKTDIDVLVLDQYMITKEQNA